VIQGNLIVPAQRKEPVFDDSNIAEQIAE